jgi:hypothetical protein
VTREGHAARDLAEEDRNRPVEVSRSEEAPLAGVVREGGEVATNSLAQDDLGVGQEVGEELLLIVV